jgi:c(7)-type cytochrome triheme protein
MFDVIRHPIILVIAIVGPWLFPATQATAQEKKDFSHIFHKEQGADDCSTCHDLSGAAPVLNTKACADCHSDGVPAWRLTTKAKREKIVFPHSFHVPKIDCLACHEKTATEKQKATDVTVPRARCEACHTEKKAAVPEHDCKLCHGSDQKKIKPQNHRNDWPRVHGMVADVTDESEHGKACTLCHKKSACSDCHRNTKPKNHTGLWRVRTHGVAADFDRNTCKTCHETGSCVFCHQTTPPLNHRGNWKTVHGLAAATVQNQQCNVCHKPANCAECHAGK